MRPLKSLFSFRTPSFRPFLYHFALSPLITLPNTSTPSQRESTRAAIFGKEYFEVKKKNGCSPFETMVAYLGGSAFQTVVDNPVTAYRQLVQQFAKDAAGKAVDPTIARAEANAVFKAAPIGASLSGLGPRLIGVGFKRIPKFGFLLGISYFLGEGGEVGMTAAVGASIFSAVFINPIRMIEKQQRAYFKTTGAEKPIMEILKEVREGRRNNGGAGVGASVEVQQ